MKTIISVIIPFFMAFSGISQITIDQNDMPDVNDTFRISTAVDIAGDPSPTGANYTWDYSGLSSASQTIDTFISVLSTPLTYQLVFNLPPWDPPASIAHPLSQPSGIPLPVIITDYIEFYKEASSDFKKVGFGATISSIPMPIKYDSPEVYYEFPLLYQNTYSSNTSYSLDIPNFIYFGQIIDRQNLVDGWGTLMLPYGNFDVLRVKSTVVTVDSIYYDSLGIGFTTPPVTTIEYKWLGKLKGVPLLQINSTTLGSTILFLDPYSPSEISENNNLIDRLEVYPNPVKDNIVIDYSISHQSDVKIDFFDISGRKVSSLSRKKEHSGIHRMEFNNEKMKFDKGVYLLRFIAGQSVITKQIIIGG